MLQAASLDVFTRIVQDTIHELFPAKGELQLTASSHLRSAASLGSLEYFAVLTRILERLEIGVDRLDYAKIALAETIDDLYDALPS